VRQKKTRTKGESDNREKIGVGIGGVRKVRDHSSQRLHRGLGKGRGTLNKQEGNKELN